MTIQDILQTILNSLPMIGRYALVTMGIVLIFRTTATTNFAQGLIATVGTFAVTWAALEWTALPLWVCLLLGMVVAFVIGMLVDVALIRRARHITPSGKQMITMGVMMILVNVTPVIFNSLVIYNTQGRSFSQGIHQFVFLGMNFNITEMGLLGFIMAAVLLSATFAALKYTKWGLGVRATAANETVAQMLGVNTRVITAFSWALAGALATVGGFFTGAGAPLSVTLMGNAQVFGFLACVLGGFGSFPAPILGAVIIPLVYNFAGNTSIMGPNAGMWQNAVTFLVVLLLILIFPNGILGKKYIRKV
ncbi:MAG: branched-chain amino acid ABC transporter permease [Clostridiales bacterium]|jgi:branched-chain amino acid transport system permease protein|nr:branched-chain amino acid ABC transporter permease [Clostridiales bacterium]